MADFQMTITKRQFASLSKRLTDLTKRAKNLEPFFERAGEYLKNSVRYRLSRSKTAPDGTPWPTLSELTVDLKGHGEILYDTGALFRSIKVGEGDAQSITVVADVDYASYMQLGVKRTGGAWPGREIPARPFMGFSDRNVKEISRMLKDHVAGRTGSGSGYGEAD